MKKGFTLIELLIVIALIAIVSTLAVSKLGGVREAASRKVSVANQKQVERAVEAFLTQGGQLNRLDGLTYASARGASGSDGAAAGFNFDETFTPSGAQGWPYLGPSDDEAVRGARNAGLDPALQAVLCRYGLSTWEADCLQQRLGLKVVMRHYPKAYGYPSMNGFTKGDDGTVPNAADGLDANDAACIANAVTNGLCVLAVNPKTDLGRTIYQAFGQELMNTKSWGESYTDAEVKKEVEATGGALLAFGLGDCASIIGKANAGLESAPYSTYVLKKYYSRYILLFRLSKAGVGSVAVPRVEFAGVIDCMGNTIRAAELVIKRL